MQKDAYQQYLELIKLALAGQKDKLSLNPDLINSRPSNLVYLTLKNYKKPKGLSVRLSESTGEIYKLKGPLGKGLDIMPKGTHIAFTGGTGVLVFIDLVAHLIRKVLGLLD